MRGFFGSKNNVFKLFFMVILLFVMSYVIYLTQRNYTITCTLNIDENNYKERIKVIINEKEVYTENNFSSDNLKIVNVKNNELKSLNYKISKSSNRLISSKTVMNSKSSKKLAYEYNNSGYSCSLDNSKRKKVEFSLDKYEKNIEINSEYKDSEYKFNLDNEVVIDNSNVDIKNVGNYMVIYKTKVGIQDYYLYEDVNVIDSVKPVINLKGDKHLVIDINSLYNEEGYTVTDNSSKDLTGEVKVFNNVDTSKAGTYFIKYTVKDQYGNSDTTYREVVVKEIKETDRLTYVNGFLVANKKYSLPKDYNPGLNKEALSSFIKLKEAASKDDNTIELLSGFRSYESQEKIYNNYKKLYKKDADTFSAPPGNSEHQTGLAMDVGKIDDNYGETKAGKWLNDNCYKYGFIIRYPKGKSDSTGYVYEPWHIRYVGIDMATNITNSGLTFEEYFKI